MIQHSVMRFATYTRTTNRIATLIWIATYPHEQNYYNAIRLAEHCFMLEQHMLTESAFAFVTVQIHNHIHNTVLIGPNLPDTK
jgi:hypothetical protein